MKPLNRDFWRVAGGLLTIEEAAKALSVPIGIVTDLIGSEQLAVAWDGGQPVVSRREVEALAEKKSSVRSSEESKPNDLADSSQNISAVI